MNSLKNGFLIMLGTFTRIPVRAPEWTDENTLRYYIAQDTLGTGSGEIIVKFPEKAEFGENNPADKPVSTVSPLNISVSDSNSCFVIDRNRIAVCILNGYINKRIHIVF